MKTDVGKKCCSIVLVKTKEHEKSTKDLSISSENLEEIVKKKKCVLHFIIVESLGKI